MRNTTENIYNQKVMIIKRYYHGKTNNKRTANTSRGGEL